MDSKIRKVGEILAKRDDIVENILYIAEGRVTAVRDKMSITLRKGDFIGIADFANGLHSFDYYVSQDAKVVSFCTVQMLVQSNFFSTKTDNARAVALSMNHYLRDIYVYLNSLCNRSEEIHKFAVEYYDTYFEICKELHMEVDPLGSYTNLAEGVSMSISFKCLYQYHKGIYTILADKESAQTMADNVLIPGHMYHSSVDFNDLIKSKDYVETIIEEHNDFLINDSHEDLLGRFFDLYSKLGDDHSLSGKIQECMVNICAQAKETSEDIKNLRIDEIKNKTRKFAETPKASQGTGTVQDMLDSSLDQILTLIKYDEDKIKEFKNVLKTYKDNIDSNSYDDENRVVRKEIEKYFYQIYLLALDYAFENDEIPIILKMFLNFGYLDEELAGMDNACELYDLAQTYRGRPELGLFTGFEWLFAIYIGEREPSINEFDQTFEQFVNEQVANGKIPHEHLKACLKDRGQMVMFELQNMFRSASRICSGRILDFCPIFCENQVLRSPKEEILNPASIIETRDGIRRIDYTLFYRETMFVYDKKDNVHDMIHVEVLPDIVLLPVVGSRGSMWQEIAGRNRLTPARMMLPVFNTANLEKVMLRMFAEYRWEMCKRVQGARWNDVTEPSLTSLYYDYLQFYRRNSQISMEQKEKIKIGLQRARNVYKEYFVNDYMEYIGYESSGSPHLIRPSRAILFFQCPFSSEIRASIGDNPIFKELNDRLKVKYSQQLHKLDNIGKKLASKGAPIPKELGEEVKYFKP